MGKTPARQENSFWIDGKHDWISIKDLSNSSKYISETNERLSDIAVEKTGIKIIPKNTVIMSFKLSIGKVAITSKDMYSNEAIMAFHDKKIANILPEYLYYLLLGNKWDEGSNTAVMGLTLNKATLSKIKVKIHDIVVQKKIVQVLNNIDRQIESKKVLLKDYNQLVKSRFVEMFGDPTSNPNGHEIKSIYELFDVGSSKRVFESEWADKGVPFYRAREIVKLAKDGFVDNSLFITEAMYEDYKNKFGVPKANDMMVTGVGTLGICYIVKDTDRFYFKDGNTLWFKNKGLCDIKFIKYQFDTDYVKDQITKNANVSTVGTYTITNAKNTQVIVPPLSMQKEYAAFVNQVDKLKFEDNFLQYKD
jgi:type I restriction enzyme S subunit